MLFVIIYLMSLGFLLNKSDSSALVMQVDEIL